LKVAATIAVVIALVIGLAVFLGKRSGPFGVPPFA
jgi:hypothetical protein